MSRVVFSDEAERWMRKADPNIARLIRNAAREIAALEDPKSRGKALTGDFAGLWRYRVRDYRMICDIVDQKTVIMVIKVGKRDKVYDR